MCVNETFLPAALSCLRRASSTPTASVRNDVAVGIDRLSSMYFASIAAAPLSAVDDGSVARFGWLIEPFGVSPFAAARTSALTIRPSRPLPGSVPRLTPRSAAARFAIGEALTDSFELPASAAAGAAPAALPFDSTDPFVSAIDAEPFESAAGAAATASGSAVISAITCPTLTVSPSSARIFVTIPAAGEGTSASTLSVDISTIVSSSPIVSPSEQCHSRIVPSVTDSPISGMTTSIVVCAAICP